MVNQSRVKINTASARELEALYGIGPVLAERIVDYRKNKGYFHNTDDLARVSGLSLELASALSPFIDWDIPTTKPKIAKLSRIDTVVVWGVGIVLAIAVVVLCVGIPGPLHIQEAMLYLNEYLQGDMALWTWVWNEVSSLVVDILIALNILVALAIGARIISGKENNRALGKALVFLNGLFLLALCSVGAANLVYYQFYEPTHWIGFLASPGNRSQAAFGLAVLMYVLPIVLVFWKPSVAQQPLTGKLFDLGFVVAGAMLALVATIIAYLGPVWFAVVEGIVGIALIYTGLVASRKGRSFLSTIIGFYHFTDPSVPGTFTRYWQTWINIYLPDPQQQRYLKDTLEKMHPPSPWRTVGGIIVVSIGGWLVLTTVVAVVQWFAQRLLGKG